MLEELKTKYQNCEVHFICTDKEGKPVSGQHVHASSIGWDDYTHELIITVILGKNTVSFLDLMEIIRNGSYSDGRLDVEAIAKFKGEAQKTILKNVYGIREITKTSCEDCTSDVCRVYISIWYDERISKRL